MAARRALVESGILRVAALVGAKTMGPAEAAGAADSTPSGTAAARAAFAVAATSAGDPLSQTAARSAVAAAFAASAPFAAVDVATSEFAVAGVLTEELANWPAGVASDQRTRRAAVGGDVAAIAATHKTRLGAAASQQA